MSAHTQQADQERPCGQVQSVALEQLKGLGQGQGTWWISYKFFLGRIYCISKLHYRLKHHLNEKGFLISKTIRILRIDDREAKEI